MKTLVLVGGSFNPITKAHLDLGIKTKRMFPFADIVYVPSNVKYISEWKITDYGENFPSEMREELLRVALEPLDFLLDMREANGELSGKTYDLVMDYKKKGYDNVYFCIGGDKVEELPKWYKANELLDEAKVIVFDRGETKVDLSHPFYQERLEKIVKANISNDLLNVSSTQIRKAFANNRLEDAKDMLPIEVYTILQRRCKM